LSIWLPNSTCVPFSTSDTKRICGYALAPRLAPGREKASSLTFSSATSKVLPSRLTNRWIAQPLHSFQQTAQYLPIGRLHVKRQGDDVVNNHLRRKIALTNTGRSR